MKINPSYALPLLFLVCTFHNGCASHDASLAQFRTNKDDSCSMIAPTDLGVQNYLILKPGWAAVDADNYGSNVGIPFSVKNISDRDVKLLSGDPFDFINPPLKIQGLAFLNQAGKADWIERFRNTVESNNGGQQARGAGVDKEKREVGEKTIELRTWSGQGRNRPVIILKPGETRFLRQYWCNTDVLRELKGTRIFAVIEGEFVDTKKTFTCYSAPFLPSNILMSWDDLGVRDYVSIMPDVAGIYLMGGPLEGGWAKTVFVPITVMNTSDKKLIVENYWICYYIVGNEKTKQEALKLPWWYLMHKSSPALAPGEWLPGEMLNEGIPIKDLEHIGYKPGDQIVAVLQGRIANTNKLFECCSAPFTLPPLPRGEPPDGAGKQS